LRVGTWRHVVLLENYPEQNKHVEQFIKGFFEHTIDNYLSVETPAVLKKRIRSANVRFLTDQKTDEEIRRKSENVYKTFCGYVHASYSHIMQSYGGAHPDLSFNLLGVPSDAQKKMKMKIVERSYISVLYSIFFICFKFQQDEIKNEIKIMMDDAAVLS